MTQHKTYNLEININITTTILIMNHYQKNYVETKEIMLRLCKWKIYEWNEIWSKKLEILTNSIVAINKNVWESENHKTNRN